MPIVALPEETSRAITSSLVLNDAVSVVKELIDNALDARASTVSIEISSNSLDVIQVKDNGTGIGVEDRQLLCKRGCTSKIRKIEDLASIGGTFLGFRGEALASVTELSGSVTITTRIEGELVGSALTYEGGKLVNSSSASHPVGTTLRIQDFLSKIPVRKQTALKSTAKTLGSLRKLLYGYAFARPETRFSFKVLKSRDGKANWSYVPSHAAAPLSEVATKIVGKDVCAQCKMYSAQSAAEEGDSSKSPWTILALLLDPASDLSNSSGAEQHFSVDKRPVNAERGMMRELSKMYKQYFRSACNRVAGKMCPSRPFLYVRMSCPDDSYDVNVEPAKDELLFYKPLALRVLFEDLLTKAYGKLELDAATGSSSGRRQGPERIDNTSFDLLMARKPNLEPPSAQRVDSASNSDHVSNHGDRPRMSFNMYAGNDETIPLLSESSEVVDEECAQDRELAVNNPWAIAKMNVVLSPKKVSSNFPQRSASDPMAASSDAGGFASPRLYTTLPGNVHRTSPEQQSQLPSPATSPTRPDSPYQNPGPPSQVMRRRGPRLDESDDESASSSVAQPPARSPSLLESWVKQAHRASQQVLAEDRSTPESREPSSPSWSMGQSPRRQGRVSMAANEDARSSQHNASFQQGRMKLSFKSPFKQRTNQQSDATLSGAGNGGTDVFGRSMPNASSRSVIRRSISPSRPFASSNQQDLDEILQFERQKRITIAQQRKEIARNARDTPPGQPSHSQRYGDAFCLASENSQIQGMDAQEAFNNRFATSDGVSTSERHAGPRLNNPHQNRYLAAVRDLDQSKSMSAPARRTENAPVSGGDDLPNIPDSDPRGYLIHHIRVREKQDQAGATSAKKTGLKIKRTKTMRLPLESIPVGEATHDLACSLTPPNAELLATQASQLADVDDYPVAREVSLTCWQQDATVVEKWQDVLVKLIESKYRHSRAVSDVQDELGGDVNFEIHLSETIEKHVASFGG